MVVTRLVTRSVFSQKKPNFFLLRFSLIKRRGQPAACQNPIFIGSIGIFKKRYPKSSQVSQSTTPTLSMVSRVNSPR